MLWRGDMLKQRQNGEKSQVRVLKRGEMKGRGEMENKHTGNGKHTGEAPVKSGLRCGNAHMKTL